MYGRRLYLENYTTIKGLPTTFFFLFFRRRFIFHKTNLRKKSFIQYQTYYIQETRNKDKKETKNIKRRKKRKGGSHYVIHSIESHNPFRLFSLYILCDRLDE